ncbi:MAG: hypothetical protein IJ191_07515 [Treponema sp.]|nr:hypothetical protein [Treponema sp.]
MIMRNKIIMLIAVLEGMILCFFITAHATSKIKIQKTKTGYEVYLKGSSIGNIDMDEEMQFKSIFFCDSYHNSVSVNFADDFPLVYSIHGKRVFFDCEVYDNDNESYIRHYEEMDGKKILYGIDFTEYPELLPVNEKNKKYFNYTLDPPNE